MNQFFNMQISELFLYIVFYTTYEQALFVCILFWHEAETEESS